MVEFFLLCHFIIRKSADHGYRPKVQIAINYSILGFFSRFQIRAKSRFSKLHFISWAHIQKISSSWVKFKSRAKILKLPTTLKNASFVICGTSISPLNPKCRSLWPCSQTWNPSIYMLHFTTKYDWIFLFFIFQRWNHMSSTTRKILRFFNENFKLSWIF